MDGKAMYFGFALLVFQFTLILVVAGENTTEIAGFEFGEVRNFTTINGFVFHVEIDETNSSLLIFATSTGLHTTDGYRTTTLVGINANRSIGLGYVEGVGLQARFSYIRDFVQLHKRHIIVVDQRNHCLRLVNRPLMITQMFAGTCQQDGFADGQPGNFHYPASILRDVHSDGVYVTDNYNNALRYVDLINRVVSTVLSFGLRSPQSVSFGFNNRSLLFTNYHYISRYDLESKTLTNITGDPGRARHVNGNLSVAKFFYPRELIPLNENVTLLTDFNNNRLRIIDEGSDRVSSICAGRRMIVEGPASTCQILQPETILLVGDLLYIGLQDAISTLRVRPLPEQPTLVPPPICPDNMTVTVERDDQRATVVLLHYEHGGYVPIQYELPVGLHSYSLPTKDNTTCDFTVSITANSSGLEENQLNCTSRSTELTLHANQSSVSVELLPGAFITLSAGFYEFQVPETNCSVQITVNQAPVEQCPDDSLSVIADPITNRASVSLPQHNEEFSSISLPVGEYDYTYNLGSLNCSMVVRVIDYSVKKRLAFEADYDIKCAELSNQQVRSVLVSGAQHKYLQIEELCAGKCKRSADAQVDLTCEGDVTTIRWPTDTVLSGAVDEVPASIRSVVTPKLKMKTLLDVILFSRIPPVVFPTLNEEGLVARLVLNPSCETGFELETASGPCTAVGGGLSTSSY